MIAEAVEALGLESPTIVGNDSGGGLTQIALSRHPELAGRVVLTSCDAYDNFPPRFFKVILAPTRFPALDAACCSRRFGSARSARLRSRSAGSCARSSTRRSGDSYMLPILTEKAIARDFARFMSGFDPSFTLDAIEKLRTYDRPVLIAWSRDDRFFPPAHAERLAADIPGARLEWIEDAYTFSMEDQPERLAELIAGFVREPVASPEPSRADSVVGRDDALVGRRRRCPRASSSALRGVVVPSSGTTGSPSPGTGSESSGLHDHRAAVVELVDGADLLALADDALARARAAPRWRPRPRRR